MAIDNTTLAQLALAEVGEEPLTALTDSTKAATIVTKVLPQARDEMFDKPVNWKFASTRVQLAALSTAPAFGYTYQYAMPPAFRRLITFVDSRGDTIEYPYKREIYQDNAGKWVPVILSNYSPCYMRYLALIENPALWPAWFARLVYLNIAIKICKPLTRDVRQKLDIRNALREAWNDAKAANGMEDTEVDDSGNNLDLGNRDVLDAAGDNTVESNYQETT